MTDLNKLERQLKAVGNKRRLRILTYLKKHGSAIVTHIAKDAGIQFPATSQHLRILRNAGIVVTNKRSLNVSYRLALKQEEPVKQVLSML